MIDHICFLLEHHFSIEYMFLLHILFFSVLQFTSYALFFLPFVFLDILFPLFGMFFLYLSSGKTLLIGPLDAQVSQLAQLVD